MEEGGLRHFDQDKLLKEVRSLRATLTTANNLRLNMERHYGLKKGRKAWAYGFRTNFDKLNPPKADTMSRNRLLLKLSSSENSSIHDLIEVVLWRGHGNSIEVASVRNGSIYIAKIKEYQFATQIYTSLKDALAELYIRALAKIDGYGEYVAKLDDWKTHTEELIDELKLSIQREDILDKTGKVAEASKLLDSLIAKDGSI